jgi:predicted RecB family nuclease
MTYPISKIDGLTAFAATKLKKAGIRTMEGLLDAAHSAKCRKELAAKTGFSEQQLLEWANLADYLRIPGMGKAKAELLRASGVNTVRELTYRNPARLALAMREANDKRKLVRVMPSEKSVGDLIEKARQLPLKISY